MAGGTSINRNSPFPISLCTVYRTGLESSHLFLDLLGVLQDALGLQSPTSLLQSPGLYTVTRVSTSTIKGYPRIRNARPKRVGEATDVGKTKGDTYEVSGLKTYATPAARRLPMNP